MNILLFGSYRDGHDILLKEGHDVTLFIPRNKYLKSDLDKSYRNYFCYDKIASPEAIISFCRQQHSITPFDCVVTFNDDDHLLGKTVSDELKIFNLQNENDIVSIKDKHYVRTILDKWNIPSCKSVKVSDIKDFLEIPKQIGFPMIIKPLSGTASFNINKINDLKEFSSFCENDNNDAFPFIAEEFLVGSEYSVESISINGKHRVIAVTEKIKNTVTFVETGHIVPARIDKNTFLSIECYVINVLNALGVNNGPCHTEIITTHLGPILVETQIRTGGDFIIKLVKESTGVDIYDLQVKQCLGIDITQMLPSIIDFKYYSAVIFDDKVFDENIIVNSIDTSGLSPYVQVNFLNETPCKISSIKSSTDRLVALIHTGDMHVMEFLEKQRELVVYNIKDDLNA